MLYFHSCADPNNEALDISGAEIQQHFDHSRHLFRERKRQRREQGEPSNKPRPLDRFHPVWNMMASNLDVYPEFQGSIRPPESILYHDWTTRFPPLDSMGSSSTALRLLNVRSVSSPSSHGYTNWPDGGCWSPHSVARRLLWHHSSYSRARGQQSRYKRTSSRVSLTVTDSVHSPNDDGKHGQDLSM
jgi:hypothetical protein